MALNLSGSFAVCFNLKNQSISACSSVSITSTDIFFSQQICSAFLITDVWYNRKHGCLLTLSHGPVPQAECPCRCQEMSLFSMSRSLKHSIIMSVLHIFWAASRTMCPGDQNIIGYVRWCKNSWTPDKQKTKPVVVNKTKSWRNLHSVAHFLST